MAPNEKTLVDQETGYSSLSEATPLKEHKSSWRRSGVAAAVLSALALGAVAAIKTTSPMRGSKNTAFYPKATIENWSKLPVSGEVHYAGDGLFCRADSYSLKKRGDVWTAKSRGGCLLTEITATIKRNGKDVRCDPYTSSGTSYSKFFIEEWGGSGSHHPDIPFSCGAFHDTGPPYTDDNA